MTVEREAPTPSPVDELEAAFQRLKAAWNRDGALSYKERMRLLKALKTAILQRKDAIVEAIDADFGGRSRAETLLGEVFLVIESIRYTRKHLQDWMAPEEREISWHLQPAKGRIVHQALGVVGVVSPWNYPFQLAFFPIIAALSAGNRILVKPSEYTPETNRVLGALLKEVFSEEVVQLVEGGPEVGAAFTSLPFDHLFFTGSTKVGRMVMRAAAENLTPVTLELGGKSPALVHPSFPVGKAAERIGWGKTFNAGQTCIAPDYILTTPDNVTPLVEALTAWVSKAYPTIVDNPDYTSIIHPGHHKRLVALVADAEAKGATRHEINPAGEDLSGCRKLPLTLLTGCTDDMDVLTEEIFGPVLPIVAVPDLDAAIAYVNARPRPLSLYCFDRNRKRQEQVLTRTISGGVCLNDCLLHNSQEELPFGGVGPSGMGSYHGHEGFLTFTHRKSVLAQSRLAGTALLNPPYSGLVETVSKVFIGL